MALWNLIRNRTMNNDICTRAVIWDDMKVLGLDVKNSIRWLARHESRGRVSISDEKIAIIRCVDYFIEGGE